MVRLPANFFDRCGTVTAGRVVNYIPGSLSDDLGWLYCHLPNPDIRYRSKRLFQVAAFAAVLGCLPFLLLAIMKIVLGYGGLFSLFPLAWQIIYTFTLTTTVYYRLRGIRI